MIEEHPTHGRDVVVTADERGALGRKVRRRDVERARRRVVVLERRSENLEERDRAGDVAESMIPASIDGCVDQLGHGCGAENLSAPRRRRHTRRQLTAGPK